MTRSILFRHRSGSSNLPPRAAWHGEGERDAMAVDQSGWEQRAGGIFGIRGFLAVKAGLRGFLDGMPSRAGQGVRTSHLASLRQRGGAYGRLCLGDWKVRFYFGSLRLFLGPEIWVSVFHVTSAFG